MAACAACLVSLAFTGFAARPAQAPEAITYPEAQSGPQQADVYRSHSGTRSPVLVMLTADRRHDSTLAWVRDAIAHGITVVVPDAGDRSVAAVLDGWLAYQRQHAAALEIDPEAVGIFAPSGLVSEALPYVEDPRHLDVKAAVFYYGAGRVQQFRLDLPIMFVRAGLDRPQVNAAFDRLVGAALAQNAPISVANYSGAPHAFDVIEGGPMADALRDRAIVFLRESLSAVQRDALRARVAVAHAAGAMTSADAARAATEYEALVAERPADERLRLSYGEALLEAGRVKDACNVFAPLRGGSLGKRDVGVPAARACARAGDADAALGWLRSIPTFARPIGLEDDPAFERLRLLPAFQALFKK